MVVDPGVWISALIGRPGPPDELLQAAAEGRAVVLVSPLLLAELREVVNRAKFRRYFTIEEAESFIAALELLAHHVEDPSRDRWVQICPDPDDDYLVALAEVAEATLLVSGDRNVLSVQRPGLDVRSPRAALEALAYRHPWGPALIPGKAEAAVAQAEAEGHGAVLRTVSAFLAVVQDPRAKELLALVVTPESLPTWRRDLGRSRATADNRGMATRAEYPAANVAYVKPPPDSGDTVRATGHVLLEGAVIVTLQLRPELPGGEELAGW